MKQMKKITYGGLLFGVSLMLLGGCGSNHQSKETTASSIQTESSSKKSNSSTEEQSPVSLKHPFNDGYPMYVADNDDNNRRVKAIIVPYADTDNKIKVTTYNSGNEEKSYIVQYKIKEIDKGTKNEPAIYRYSFYDNENHEWSHYDAGYIRYKDIKDQVFIELAHINKDRIKGDKIKDYSPEELNTYVENHICPVLYDNSKYVSIK